MCNPSSYRLRIWGDHPPGDFDPVSPWCPPQATQASSSSFQKTGIIRKWSYVCTPPPSGSLKKKMSPSSSPTVGSSA